MILNSGIFFQQICYHYSPCKPLSLTFVDGINVPIHFGIIVVVNMELGAITPPIGMNLFMASTISKMPLYEVMLAALPWTLVIAFVLMVITYVPWISTVLPNLYFG